MAGQHKSNDPTGTTHTERRGLLQLDRSYEVGNAGRESQPFRGWLAGGFVPDHFGLRATNQLEVKWGQHLAGEGQAEWTLNRTATTISILLRGRDMVSFPDGDVLLEHEGDYVAWGPGVPHRWHALADSVVLTIRWPSVAGDSIPVSDEALAAWQAKRVE